jgi:carbon storage regulator
MLVLSRKIGETITIGNSITITVLGFDRGFVKLGIEAPKSVPVHRKEIYDKIIEVNRQAASTEISALKNAIQASGLRSSRGNGATSLSGSTLVVANQEAANGESSV